MIIKSALAATALGLAGIACATTVVTAAPASAAIVNEGAIAVSTSTGTIGSSWNYHSVGDAQIVAVRNCGHADCTVLTTFTFCGAVAVNRGYWHGGYGTTLAAAESDAIAGAGGGRIAHYTCNGR
ncbi:DUF4189 domain-containing protein [Nocardia sp. NPDC059240]|uniref:DUF4189 domain-containing protein n=1 Tax=Nocardia sp. NPDC059240 TaxID=3346786 RepID=UPI0036AF985E